MSKQVKELNTEMNPSLNVPNVYDHLVTEGFRPSIDEDGDIRFKAEGRVYFIRFDEQDPTFIRLCAINVAASLDLHLEQAMDYANQVNSDIKVSKAFCLMPGEKPVIWITSECRYAGTAEFMAQFDKLISGIRVAVDHLYEIHKKGGQLSSDDDLTETKAIH